MDRPIDLQMILISSIEDDDYDCSVPQEYSVDYVPPAEEEEQL